MIAESRLLVFFASWSLSGSRPMRARFVVLHTRFGPKRVRCTEPLFFLPFTEPPLIVFVHGMGLEGERDGRAERVCESLASAGYRVLAPRIDEVAALRFGSRSIDEIEAVVEAAADDRALSFDGRVAVAAVSFSGAAALIACSRASLRDRVSGALLLGTYCDVRLCVEQLLTTARDDYGRLIAIMNFLRFADENSPAVDSAILKMCGDNVAGRPEQTRINHLRSLAPNEGALLLELLTSVAARKALLGRALAKTPDLWGLLDLAPALPHLRFPIAVMHGASDEVIDVAQAHLLAASLAAHGHPHRLCITSWIDHGTPRGLLGTGLSILGVAEVIRYFFRAIDRRFPRHSRS